MVGAGLQRTTLWNLATNDQPALPGGPTSSKIAAKVMPGALATEVTSTTPDAGAVLVVAIDDQYYHDLPSFQVTGGDGGRPHHHLRRASARSTLRPPV